MPALSVPPPKLPSSGPRYNSRPRNRSWIFVTSRPFDLRRYDRVVPSAPFTNAIPFVDRLAGRHASASLPYFPMTTSRSPLARTSKSHLSAVRPLTHAGRSHRRGPHEKRIRLRTVLPPRVWTV